MSIISFRYFFLFITVSLISCNHPDLPEDIQTVLDTNDENRAELRKVIDHYKKNVSDSLKLEAAYYLMRNLNGRFYLESDQLTQYRNYPRLVLRDIDHGEYIMNSLSKIYGSYSRDALSKRYDLKEIKASEFISNIEAAFYAWKKRPWAQDYSFAQFCDYVLPYRVDNELPEYNRMKILNVYDRVLDSCSNKKPDALLACSLINNVLIKEGWILSHRVAFLPNYHATDLIENRIGTCREMVDLGTYVMRSAGIPVTTDFVPQWPYRGLGHVWNVVLNKQGKFIPFLGAEDSPGTPHRPKTKRGKVYRKSFKVNPFSLAMKVRNDDFIPEFLKDPYIYDVTDEYAKTFTIDIPVKSKTGDRFLYLSVFNNNVWVPVCWSEIRNGKATFSKLEGGIIYMPSYYNSAEISFSGNPFILQEDGKTDFLDADTVKRIPELICNRIYPIMPESYIVDEVKGAKFQGSNSSDFKDAQDLHVFKYRALPSWNELEITAPEKFRFIRYLPAEGRVCHVAEVECYVDFTKIKGKISGYNITEKDSVQNVGDGNESSAYSTDNPSSQIIIDFNKKIQVTKIRFLPQVSITPKHLIIKGETYQLKYWSKNRWIPIETKIANSSELTFKSLPNDALFILTTQTGDKDKRIFTIKNGRQQWW